MSNKAALSEFVQLPVSLDMISYLAAKASEVIRCEPVQAGLPTPPSTPPRHAGNGTFDSSEPSLPDLETFITSIVERSHVQVSTLMTSLVYLARLKKKLPPVAKGMKCTVHRIFLASLILSAKNLNDSSPKNKHWARYTAVKGFEGFGFSLTEVNLMEKQLLFLLDWDLNISAENLYEHFEHFLAPIRLRLRFEEEQELAAIALREKEIREAEARQLQEKLERQQRKKRQELAHAASCTSLYNQRYIPNVADEDIEAFYYSSQVLDLKPYQAPPTPNTPQRDPRSRSASRSRTSSSYSNYRRTLERSRSRSTHRRSIISLDQLGQTPPSSTQIPELARSGTASSIYSNESSPRLPSPSAVAQVHFLADLPRTSPKGSTLPSKPSKKARINIFSRLLGVERSPFERSYSLRS